MLSGRQVGRILEIVAHVERHPCVRALHRQSSRKKLMNARLQANTRAVDGF